MTDAELLAAIKRYRTAYFAFWTENMRRQRDYSRARRAHEGDDDFMWDVPSDDEWRRLLLMDEARRALTEQPPADFTTLCNEMRNEFGE